MKLVSKVIAVTIIGISSPIFASAQGISNPIQYNNLRDFLEALLDVIILIAVPIIVVMIIYSGFLFVTAQGKPEGLVKARKAFFWTVIGALIILGAQALSLAIQGTVDDIQGVVQIFLG